MSVYATYEDVVNYGGFRPSDLEELGYEMSQEQAKVFIESLIKTCTNFINRYCNCETFDKRTITDELHTLDVGDSFAPIYGIIRGYPGLTYSATMYDYATDLQKFTIIPRQQPVCSVASLKINAAWHTSKPSWHELTPWSFTSDGDYKIIERYGTTKITFIRRFPAPSQNNIRLTYTAGYPPDDPVWDTLRLACALLCSNIIRRKKKNQEAYTIRGAGIYSYERMFDTDVLTPDIQLLLDQYVKDPMAAFTGN